MGYGLPVEKDVALTNRAFLRSKRKRIRPIRTEIASIASQEKRGCLTFLRRGKKIAGPNDYRAEEKAFTSLVMRERGRKKDCPP